MSKATQKKKVTSVKQFPDFDNMSLATEAEWWDTHDLSEVWHELDDIEVIFEPDGSKSKGHPKGLSSPVNIRLDPIVHKKLKLIARMKGIGVAGLVRMWISENVYGHERRLISKN